MEEYRAFIIMVSMAIAIYGSFRMVIDAVNAIVYAISVPYMPAEEREEVIIDGIYFEDYWAAACAWFVVGCLALGG